ncbi:MAG: hypothetical protein M1839_007837 [Geoglossum umbratile]|nr:MAG: hypothetical protein M1839_007837 [Geoglossum umbratile]
MSGATYQTPDLASVLRTLASLAPKQPQPVQSLSATFGMPGVPPVLRTGGYEPEEGEYEPPEPPDSTREVRASPGPVPANAPERTTVVQGQSIRDPRLHLASTPASTRPTDTVDKSPPIDATTITDWSAGLKCIMKTVAQSDAITARIKKMITVQHDHEKQWWEGRQALLKKQNARVEGKKKLDEVLRSVGGIVPAGDSISTPEQNAQELRTYDRKVYKASLDMAQAMKSELKALGIPFFGTRSNLVKGNEIGSALGEPVCDESGVVGEQELVELQKRMLGLLEDLCK